MAEKTSANLLPRIPQRSLIYGLVCGGGILCFALIAILPNQRALGQLDRDAGRLKQQIKEQEILAPLFKKVVVNLKRDKDGWGAENKRERLPQEDIANLASNFHEMATAAGMIYRESVPDPNTLKRGSGRLLVRLYLEGDFFNFRAFLERLLEFPSLDSLESLQIKSLGQAREFRLNIWLSIAN